MTKTQHILEWRQHGFLPKKSCTTQMVHFIDKLAQSINASSRTDVVYFDFMKAFDSVNLVMRARMTQIRENIPDSGKWNFRVGEV